MPTARVVPPATVRPTTRTPAPTPKGAGSKPPPDRPAASTPSVAAGRCRVVHGPGPTAPRPGCGPVPEPPRLDGTRPAARVLWPATGPATSTPAATATSTRRTPAAAGASAAAAAGSPPPSRPATWSGRRRHATMATRRVHGPIRPAQHGLAGRQAAAGDDKPANAGESPSQ